MANTTLSYETVAIFNTKNGDEAVAALVEKFKTLISENGTIDSEADWGKRKLAYPIQDETEGYYYVVNFTAAPEFPAELDRVYKITDGVLRSLIVANEQ
ncbi:small subunit ribosomal protein S6 [Hydrogenoanaerobacterium saccharovorans]|uniref:Small ribosomal subunit protein bS6 n=1 Tax=Hydrogenoanaerobacterium saccharovorans TaxID=474960 RepID=A0A1H7ZY09_9FIRM|nr:30S ribosomal protein S6 [Hydrogenoanaerobacterium saccharovorans]RPF48354.1 small subunit ribosomal protein S6 [Hydrogenoanaerobacterium saccharovorans]SEM62379.1 small subunit ribosomal protein S6 [Hydrogenoanaerobacterium saccharovorans]